MEPSVEYFHGEILRWSFGFENPNKAAVVFACLVPLFWSGWLAAWRQPPMMRGIAALAASGVGFLGTWLCLLATFSRGGIAGALAGMGLVTWWAWAPRLKDSALAWREVLRAPATFMSAALVATILAASVLLGAGSRALEAIGGDASVGNRLELWKKALQMAYENPAGFGAGSSGSEFMNWYQALDRTEGYRTMVNSYLTILVERGWFIMALGILAGAAFSVWTWPRRGEPLGGVKAALWGSLVAFFVSGIFSTTMEEPILLIMPTLAGIALATCSLRPIPHAHLVSRTIASLATALIVCAALLLAGGIESRKDPLQREFGAQLNGATSVVSVEPKAFSSEGESLGVMPDLAVLGPSWGKMLRDAALSGSRRVVVLQKLQDSENVDRLVVCGEAVAQLKGVVHDPLILLAPKALVDFPCQPRASMKVLLPEIDEDGRNRAWRQFLQGSSFSDVRVVELQGVGTQVDWAWQQVLEALNEH
jgi:hypothetical protein